MSALTAVALVLAGCGGGGDDGGASGGSSTEPSPDSSGDELGDELTGEVETGDVETAEVGTEAESPFSRTESFVTVDGETVEEVVLPTDLLEAVQAGAEGGLWTEAEGIVAALDGITGRNDPPPGLAASDVVEAGLTALTRRGIDLRTEGSLTSAEAADLDASLAFFSPTQEVLDRISQPSSRSAQPRTDDDEGAAPAPRGDDGQIRLASFRPAAVASAQEIAGGGDPTRPECSQVASMGFDSELDTGSNCYFYDEITIEGSTLRVYYPAAWLEDESRLELVDLTLDTLAHSTTTYAGFATVGDVNAVFSVAESKTAYATQIYFNPSGPCPLTIFSDAGEQGDKVYQQIVAHEVFHCVQDRTFPSTAPYGTHKWWLEGSAEFFSNVAYPNANDEHRQTGEFDKKSRTKNLTEMSYENTVFFQYYANRRGVPATIGLLRSVSSGGATVGSLTAIDGMDDLWQDFVVAFMADAVFDTGRGTVGGGQKTTKRFRIAEVGQVIMDSFPMVATRYLLEYEKEKRFVQDYTKEIPPHASVEKAEQTNLAAWTLLPEEIRSKCDEAARHLVVTTTTDRDQTFLTDVTEVETAECDPCLLGPWDLQLETFEAYMSQVFASIGGAGTGFSLDIGGNYYFDFDDEGGLDAIRSRLTIGIELGGFSAPTTEISGTDQGMYTTDGDELTISGLSGFAETSIGEQTVDSIIEPNGGSAPYDCDDDVLTINDQSYGPLTFDRIDEIPDPESVEIETGDAGSG